MTVKKTVEKIVDISGLPNLERHITAYVFNEVGKFMYLSNVSLEGSKLKLEFEQTNFNESARNIVKQAAPDKMQELLEDLSTKNWKAIKIVKLDTYNKKVYLVFANKKYQNGAM